LIKVNLSKAAQQSYSRDLKGFPIDLYQVNVTGAWVTCQLPIYRRCGSLVNAFPVPGRVRSAEITDDDISGQHTQRSAMSESDDLPKPERIPFFQRMLENPFLLLFIGVAMPTVFYVLWGVMEIATLPIAP
jgi:hypothetical protein